MVAAVSSMTLDRLNRFLGAWSHHDVELILDMMTPDAVLYSSAGSEFLGQTSIGRDAIRSTIEGLFERLPGVHWVDGESVVAGNRGFAEWTMTWTDRQGVSHSVRGCDLFEFEGDLIKTKNAFRKLAT